MWNANYLAQIAEQAKLAAAKVEAAAATVEAQLNDSVGATVKVVVNEDDDGGIDHGDDSDFELDLEDDDNIFVNSGDKQSVDANEKIGADDDENMLVKEENGGNDDSNAHYVESVENGCDVKKDMISTADNNAESVTSTSNNEEKVLTSSEVLSNGPEIVTCTDDGDSIMKKEESALVDDNVETGTEAVPLELPSQEAIEKSDIDDEKLLSLKEKPVPRLELILQTESNTEKAEYHEIEIHPDKTASGDSPSLSTHNINNDQENISENAEQDVHTKEKDNKIERIKVDNDADECSTIKDCSADRSLDTIQQPNVVIDEEPSNETDGSAPVRDIDDSVNESASPQKINGECNSDVDGYKSPLHTTLQNMGFSDDKIEYAIKMNGASSELQTLVSFILENGDGGKDLHDLRGEDRGRTVPEDIDAKEGLISDSNVSSGDDIDQNLSMEGQNIVREDNEDIRVEQTELERVRMEFVTDQEGLKVDSKTDEVNTTTIIQYEEKLNEQSSLIEQLRRELQAREEQLASKSIESANLNEQHELELVKLKGKLDETKAEAKRRIQKAKQRVEEMQKHLNAAASKAKDDDDKDEIIKALREEGAALAQSQSTIERSLRSTRKEMRELKGELESERSLSNSLKESVEELQGEVKQLSSDLKEAREGEKRAKQLQDDLDETSEKLRVSTSAQKKMKEKIEKLESDIVQAKSDTETAKLGLINEGEKEKEHLKKQRDDIFKEFEVKLRISEKEASVREDALRHEVNELRKRWQDAVRRADSLTMDVQESTAPLMRQLDAAEKQNRVRSAAWAEIELKLRSELEESTILYEKAIASSKDLKASYARSERMLASNEKELSSANERLSKITEDLRNSEDNLREAKDMCRQYEEERDSFRKMTSEEVNKTRSDLMKLVVEGEERYRIEFDKIEITLKEERRRCVDLEKELSELKDQLRERLSVGSNEMGHSYENGTESYKDNALDQAGILLSTLNGIDGEEDNQIDNVDVSTSMVNGTSFAAVDRLSQSLGTVKKELNLVKVNVLDIFKKDALHLYRARSFCCCNLMQTQLRTSETIRRDLVSELTELRGASEKFHEMEENVAYLSNELNEKEIEVQGLQEDMMDIKGMYRSQLEQLLEEKLEWEAAKTARSDLTENIIPNDTSGENEENDILLNSEKINEEVSTPSSI